LSFRLSDFYLQRRIARRLRNFSRPGVVGVSGDSRRHAGHPPAHARRRRRRGAALRRGFPAADSALRDQRHRPAPDRELRVDERLRLRFSRHPARDHRHLHAAVASLRQVLSYLSAPGAARRELLQRRRRARGAGALPPLRPSVQLADPRRRPDWSRARSRLSLRSRRRCGALSVDLPALPPRRAGARPGKALGRRAGIAGPPVDAVLRQSGARRRTARHGRQRQLSSLIMARLPRDTASVIEKFGPHLGRSAGSRLDTGAAPDKVVKTHCCFCGQQCGIELKVKDNEVIGFEPWMDFPFNQGKLCPKGVKRYLQGSHPDRLLSAYERDEAASAGFKPLAYERAIARVAAEIQRIQSNHGNHAFAVLSGASLTTEKAYLMGKFAHMCLKTSNIDYNGRLCMVSAGAANKKAFGIDRAANPWSDILKAEVVCISGANVAECAPITTDYVWQARENGAKIVVVDPRITPIARTCDLFLPIKPGRDVALFNGVLHLMIENG